MMLDDNKNIDDSLIQIEVGKRLLQYLTYLTGYSNKSDFARLIWGEDAPKAKINILNQILNGNKWFRPLILNDLCFAFPKLNLRWLLTGEGEMEINPNYHKEQTKKMEVEYNKVKNELMNYVDEKLKSLNNNTSNGVDYND